MDKPHGKLSLDPLLKPNNVAVIGATEKPGSVGRTILTNLITNPFGGTIFPSIPNARMFSVSKPIRQFWMCRTR